MSRTLSELVPAGSKVALLDVPNHDNIGDNAIFLGELRWMQACGLEPVYVADQRGYRPEHVRKWLPKKGTILLHGGGNFGNRYLRHVRLRERVLRDCKQYRVVLLPQSVHFTDPVALEGAKRAIGEHGNVVLMARSRKSYDFMRTNFHAEVVLCPDAALFLDLPKGTQSDGNVGGLMRQDFEGISNATHTFPDWPKPSMLFDRYRLGSRILSLAMDKLPAVFTSPLDVVQRPYIASVARHRVQHAIEVFAPHSVIVTDRLHGHIIATLMGIPNVALDNASGKTSDFYRTWTKDVEYCRFADDFDSAMEIAKDWL